MPFAMKEPGTTPADDAGVNPPLTVVSKPPKLEPKPDSLAARIRTWTEEEAETPAEPIAWVWHRLIPRGYGGLLQAAGGGAKTTLLCQLAVAISVGHPLFGYPTSVGHVVVVTYEDPAEEYRIGFKVARRELKSLSPLLDMKGSAGRTHVLDLCGAPGMKLTETSANAPAGVNMPVVSEMARLIKALPKDGLPVQLVIVETAALAGAGREDQDELTALMEAAKFIAREVGCATAITHHTGKKQFRDGVNDAYAGRGGSSFADNSRFVINLMPPSDEDSDSYAGTKLSREVVSRVVQVTQAKTLRRVPKVAPFWLRKRPLGPEEGMFLESLTPEGAMALAEGTGDGVTRDKALVEVAKRIHSKVKELNASGISVSQSSLRSYAAELGLGRTKTQSTKIDWAIQHGYIRIVGKRLVAADSMPPDPKESSNA